MIKKILANGYTVVGLWAAFFGYGLYLFNYGGYPRIKLLSGMDLPEEIFGASWDYQVLFLDRIGEEGVRLYLSFQWLDFLNAILLGLVLASTIYLLLVKLDAPRVVYFVVLLPFATALFDLLENGVMIANLGYLPDLGKGLASTFQFLTQAKFLFGTLSFFVLFAAIIAMAVSFILRRFRK